MPHFSRGANQLFNKLAKQLRVFSKSQHLSARFANCTAPDIRRRVTTPSHQNTYFAAVLSSVDNDFFLTITKQE